MLQFEVHRVGRQRCLLLTAPWHPWDYFYGFSRFATWL